MKKFNYLMKIVSIVSLCLILTACPDKDEPETFPDDYYFDNNDDNQTDNNNENNNSNKSNNSNPTISGSHKGYDYVDLGLSVKWATYNVGAKSPDDYGAYYAWGETNTKSNYSYETYKFTVYEKPGFRYSNPGDIMSTKYDAATQNWGGYWRIPTCAEFEELISNCSSKWVVYKGVSGRMLTARNGNSLFLPASGEYNDTKIEDKGVAGEYWTGQIVYSNSKDATRYTGAFCYYFDRNENLYLGSGYRSLGYSIRPVYATSTSGGGGGGGDQGGSSKGDAPYVISFDYTATKNSISVTFYTDIKPTSASIYYGETSADKSAGSVSIISKSVSVKVSNLKSGTKYYFKCKLTNEYGSSTSDAWPAMTNY